MTHNIQIGVNVDDESIERAVIKGAVADIKAACFPSAYASYYSEWSNEFRKLVEKAIDNMFQSEEMRKAIIGIVAEALAEKMARSKNIKDMITGKLQEVADDDSH